MVRAKYNCNILISLDRLWATVKSEFNGGSDSPDIKHFNSLPHNDVKTVVIMATGDSCKTLH